MSGKTVKLYEVCGKEDNRVKYYYFLHLHDIPPKVLSCHTLHLSSDYRPQLAFCEHNVIA